MYSVMMYFAGVDKYYILSAAVIAIALSAGVGLCSNSGNNKKRVQLSIVMLLALALSYVAVFMALRDILYHQMESNNVDLVDIRWYSIVCSFVGHGILSVVLVVACRVIQDLRDVGRFVALVGLAVVHVPWMISCIASGSSVSSAFRPGQLPVSLISSGGLSDKVVSYSRGDVQREVRLLDIPVSDLVRYESGEREEPLGQEEVLYNSKLIAYLNVYWYDNVMYVINQGGNKSYGFKIPYIMSYPREVVREQVTLRYVEALSDSVLLLNFRDGRIVIFDTKLGVGGTLAFGKMNLEYPA